MYRDYLAALWGDWVARMSGLASIVLASPAAYFEFMVKHGQAALWAAAAVCVVVASCRIWVKERRVVESVAKPWMWVMNVSGVGLSPARVFRKSGGQGTSPPRIRFCTGLLVR